MHILKPCSIKIFKRNLVKFCIKVEAEELVSSSSQDPRFVNAGVQTHGTGKIGKQKGSGSNLHMMDENELKKMIDKVCLGIA